MKTDHNFSSLRISNGGGRLAILFTLAWQMNKSNAGLETKLKNAQIWQHSHLIDRRLVSYLHKRSREFDFRRKIKHTKVIDRFPFIYGFWLYIASVPDIKQAANTKQKTNITVLLSISEKRVRLTKGVCE